MREEGEGEWGGGAALIGHRILLVANQKQTNSSGCWQKIKFGKGGAA